MNIKRLEKKLFLIAISALAAFMFALIPALSAGIAYADNGGSASNGGNESAEGSGTFSSIVYFSDYEGSLDFRNDLIRDVGRNVQRIYWDHESFEDGFRAAYNAGKYDELKDAYVIFERRYGFDYVAAASDNFVFVLLDFFYKLKENNCFIMLICGTDESLFTRPSYFTSYYTDFLNYVDIHVNTDIMSPFLGTIVEDEAAKCTDGILQDCTIVLDKNFVPSVDYDTDNRTWVAWSLKYYIARYLKSMHNEYPQFLGEWEEFFEDHNIEILCHMHDDTFYSLSCSNTVNPYDDYDSFFEKYLKNKNIFAIGGTWGDRSYVLEWANAIVDLHFLAEFSVYPGQEAPADFFPVYIYNTNGFFDVFDDFEYFFTTGAVNKDKLKQIAIDFLTDEDLTKYNNYNGVCDISHKLIDVSDDGWIHWGRAFMSAFSGGWTRYPNDGIL